jgi:two-component system OmpR family sensor kinase
MWQRASLHLQLTLAVGLLSGAMTLLFALLFYPRLQAQLLRTVDARLQAHNAQLISILVDAEPSPEGNERPPLTLPAAFEVVDYYAALIGPDGKLYATSPRLPAGGLSVDPELRAAAQAGQTTHSTVVTADGTPVRLLVSPAGAGPQAGFVLLVAESFAPQQQLLAQVRRLLLMYGALVLVLTFGLAALLTRHMLAPLTRLMCETTAVAATGHYSQRVTALPRHDEIGQFVQTINTLIATVERTLRQQREFLADTSHELRSPLTVVLANLNLLRRDLDPHERELSLDEATAEAQRMRRLINELLLLAQADAAQVIAQAPVRLDDLVKEVVAAVQRQAPGHRFQIQVEAEAALTVVGDYDRLTQLLRNLLENAAQHTPRGTVVEVRLRQSGADAQLIVADTGPGIPAVYLPQLWNRYYRVDKVRSRASGGTGLGLPIVKYIAEAHGGRVEVSSAEGAGATFVVELPLAPDSAWR